MKRQTLTLAVLLLCLLAVPAATCASTLASDRFDGCQTIEHTAYTTRWNSVTLTPAWVAYTLTPEMLSEDRVSRKGYEFTEDPLVKGTCASPMDYSRSGWARGHMMPAADCKYSATAMMESFYMTNVCPQSHSLNDQTWLELEQQVRFWCKHWFKTELHIVCGPLYEGKARRIGNNEVSVPTGFFKVICLKDTRTGRWQAMGFVFPNDYWKADYSDAAVSVDAVEGLTGIDFFPGFPEEEAMESVIPTNWKF